jgi:hypothetical protein
VSQTLLTAAVKEIARESEACSAENFERRCWVFVISASFLVGRDAVRQSKRKRDASDQPMIKGFLSVNWTRSNKEDKMN